MKWRSYTIYLYRSSTPQGLIESIQKYQAEFPVRDYETIGFDDDNLVIEFRSPETPEETEWRLKVEANKAQEERNTYLKLKAKYENEDTDNR